MWLRLKFGKLIMQQPFWVVGLGKTRGKAQSFSPNIKEIISAEIMVFLSLFTVAFMKGSDPS